MASFDKAAAKVQQVADVLRQDTAIEGIAINIGQTSTNQASIMLALKPKDSGRKASPDEIIARLRPKLAQLVGVQTFLQSRQDINVGGRTGQAQYQYTLADSDLDELNTWAPRLLTALQALPQLKDVSSDQQSQAGAVMLTIDRDAAARFGILPADIDKIGRAHV